MKLIKITTVTMVLSGDYRTLAVSACYFRKTLCKSIYWPLSWMKYSLTDTTRRTRLVTFGE